MKHLCYMIDLDGTIYHRSCVLPYAKQFIETLISCNIGFLLFTNSAELSAKGIKCKLNKMDIHVSREHIMTAGDVTIEYIKHHSDKKKCPTVFVAGSLEFKNEMSKSGIHVLEDSFHTADYVVAGYSPDLTMHDLTHASILVNKGAVLLSTNQDTTIPAEHAFIPHTGAVTAFIEAATGAKAISLGKPEVHTLKAVLKQLNCRQEDLCVIGDNLRTDIMFGEKFQLSSYLVYTGLTTKEMFSQNKFSNRVIPIDNLGELMKKEML